MAQKWTPLTTNESQWPAPQSTQLEFPLTDWPSESQPQKPEDISYIPTTSYTPPGSASRTNLAVQQQGRSYEPFILRKPAGIALVTMLVLLGAGVMILGFIVNDKVGGLGPVTTSSDQTRWAHYLWTLPTVALVIIAASVSAALSSLDFSLKRIEPYRQLSRGNASADRSLLLDYIGLPKIFSWQPAIKNGHMIVATSSIASLLALIISPLASAIFIVKTAPSSQTVTGSLQQNLAFVPEWDAVGPAYSAANLVSTVFLANGSLPPYATSGWAFPSFALDSSVSAGISSNSTLSLTLPGIVTAANCEDTDITFNILPLHAGDNNRYNASMKGKQSGSVFYKGIPEAFGNTQYEGDTWPLNNEADQRRQSFIYTIWTPLEGGGPPNMSAVICSPTVQMQKVRATFDSATRTVVKDSVQTGAGKASPLSILNNTASALNGYYFDRSIYGDIVGQRINSTQFALISVMYQAALNHPGGIAQAYADGAHYNLTKSVYQTYLSLMALNTFWNNTAPDSPKVTMTSTSLQNLLFVSELPAVLVCVILEILAVVALGLLIAHWRTFSVSLRVNPNTMAGQGVMLTRGSDVPWVLDEPGMEQRHMKKALRQHKWALVGGRVCIDDGGMARSVHQTANADRSSGGRQSEVRQSIMPTSLVPGQSFSDSPGPYSQGYTTQH